MSVTSPEEWGHIFAVREGLVPLVAFADSHKKSLISGVRLFFLSRTLA
jgi:hypothetical protein